MLLLFAAPLLFVKDNINKNLSAAAVDWKKKERFFYHVIHIACRGEAMKKRRK